LQPDASFHGLEGWEAHGNGHRPSIYDDTLADEDLAISTEDAYRLVKRIAREEALLVSPSAVPPSPVALSCAKVPRDQHAVMVTVFADSGRKISQRTLWDEY